MIYVIGTGEPWSPVKIGYSWGASAMKKRLRSLQTGNHQRLYILRAYHGRDDLHDRQLEYNAHFRFKDAKLVGEWFDPLVDHWIERLATTARTDEVEAVWAEIEPPGFLSPRKVRRRGWNAPTPERVYADLRLGLKSTATGRPRKSVCTALQAATSVHRGGSDRSESGSSCS